MPNPTIKALRAVWGTGVTDIYAAGEDGVLFRFNGGTWTALDSRTTQIILGLSGATDERVFAVGGTATVVTGDR
jgi:hypothetical protein